MKTAWDTLWQSRAVARSERRHSQRLLRATSPTLALHTPCCLIALYRFPVDSVKTGRSAHATVVLGLDMWMRRLRSIGVATTTASAGTASIVLARSSTCTMMRCFESVCVHHSKSLRFHIRTYWVWLAGSGSAMQHADVVVCCQRQGMTQACTGHDRCSYVHPLQQVC